MIFNNANLNGNYTDHNQHFMMETINYKALP